MNDKLEQQIEAARKAAMPKTQEEIMDQ